MNWAPARIGARELHDVYLHPFEAAVRTAGLRSVMNAYNEVDGMPCAADRALLTGLLRGVGFRRLRRLRLLRGPPARDVPPARRRRRARRGGGARGRDRRRAAGHRLLRRAAARRAPRAAWSSEETLDDAVRRVLATKFELGLFERPFVDVAAVADAARRRDTARAREDDRAQEPRAPEERRHACRSRPDTQRIAVIGPNADELRHLFGDYCYPAHVESLREMLEAGENVFSIARPGRPRVRRRRCPTRRRSLDALRARLGAAGAASRAAAT